MAIKIHVFDPEIYPRKLFVMRGKDLKKLISDVFCNSDGETLNIADIDADAVGACTWPTVKHRDSGKLGVLVWIVGDASPKSLAHESVHVVNAIFSETGVDVSYEHDEHYAYMLGWVMDCLWQVITGKFKEETWIKKSDKESK